LFHAIFLSRLVPATVSSGVKGQALTLAKRIGNGSDNGLESGPTMTGLAGNATPESAGNSGAGVPPVGLATLGGDTGGAPAPLWRGARPIAFA
jgi:hypothetical protein